MMRPIPLRDVLMEERRAYALMRTVVQPETHCIDIGSHMGAALREMTRLAPKGHHLAIEADPFKAAWLRTAFPTVTIHTCQLSDTNGMHEVPRRHAADPIGTVEYVQVATRRLDDLADPVRPPGFIRLDLGAMRAGTITGAERVLRGGPILLLAATPDPSAVDSTLLAETLDQLRRAYGYRWFPVSDWINDLADSAEWDLQALLLRVAGGSGLVAIPD
ncbi:MAG: hypothetical protein ACFCUG_08010 [Thiotrichales bacterium]